MRVGAIIGRHSQPTEPEDVRELGEARIAAARRHNRWTEVPYDLVPRGPYLVSASTDEIFLPHRGVVFESRSAKLIADMAPLVFTVTDDGEILFVDRQPGSWSAVVEQQQRLELQGRGK